MALSHYYYAEPNEPNYMTLLKKTMKCLEALGGCCAPNGTMGFIQFNIHMMASITTTLPPYYFSPTN